MGLKKDAIHEENKSGRFITLSAIFHAALIASITLLSLPKFDAMKPEVMELEVAGGGEVLPTQGAAPLEAEPTEVAPLPAKAAVAAMPVSAPAAPEDVAVPVTTAKVEPTKVEAPKTVPVAPPVVKVAPVAKANPAPKVATPETIDDIQAPELESSEADSTGTAVAANLDDKDLDEDFEKVDKDHSQKVATLKKDMDSEADKVAQENEEALKEADRKAKAEAAAIAAANKARRDQEAKAIAAAQAAEAAEAARAAKAAADAEKAKNATGTGGIGEGSGDTGSPAPTKEVAGIGAVRALEQLRQKPGNKFPQYDIIERKEGQQGEAVFYAYVNKDGSLSQFKLGQSTGYKNLDAKTLTALKKWKFYPGQEGWVEMPFKWNLNGDAMEAGGTLRIR